MTRRLGKGLADLIDSAPAQEGSEKGLVLLRTDQIHIGNFQPRVTMDEKAIEELKASIKRQGVIEPIIVRPHPSGAYELVAGERRLRACQELGLSEIPALVRTLSDQEAFEYALMENVQRENLNPIEEARGYARMTSEFGYTQEQVAQAVGRDRATVTNLLRLLTLPDEIQQALCRGTITTGHAKALLSVESRVAQMTLYQTVIGKGITVRRLESLASQVQDPSIRRAKRARGIVHPQWQSMEDALRQKLGTKVSLLPRKKGGRILIEYFSEEDLTRLFQVLGLTL